MIDWTTVAITLLPMGLTAVGGGVALKVRSSQHTRDIAEVSRKLEKHITEDAEVHGDVREMRADIRWIREALERMEGR